MMKMMNQMPLTETMGKKKRRRFELCQAILIGREFTNYVCTATIQSEISCKFYNIEPFRMYCNEMCQ